MLYKHETEGWPPVLATVYTRVKLIKDAGAHVRLVGFVWIRKYPDIMSAFDQPRDVQARVCKLRLSVVITYFQRSL